MWDGNTTKSVAQRQQSDRETGREKSKADCITDIVIPERERQREGERESTQKHLYSSKKQLWYKH